MDYGVDIKRSIGTSLRRNNAGSREEEGGREHLILWSLQERRKAIFN